MELKEALDKAHEYVSTAASDNGSGTTRGSRSSRRKLHIDQFKARNEEIQRKKKELEETSGDQVKHWTERQNKNGINFDMPREQPVPKDRAVVVVTRAVTKEVSNVTLGCLDHQAALVR